MYSIGSYLRTTMLDSVTVKRISKLTFIYGLKQPLALNCLILSGKISHKSWKSPVFFLVYMAHYIHYSGNAVSRFAPNNLMSLLPRQWKTFSVVNERELFTANFYCVFLVLMSHVLYLALTFGYNFILMLYTTSPFLKTHNWLGLRKLSLQHKYWYQRWRTCTHCSFL